MWLAHKVLRCKQPHTGHRKEIKKRVWVAVLLRCSDIHMEISRRQVATHWSEDATGVGIETAPQTLNPMQVQVAICWGWGC